MNQFEIRDTGEGLAGDYKVIRVPSGARLTVDVRNSNGHVASGEGYHRRSISSIRGLPDVYRVELRCNLRPSKLSL